MDNVEVIVTRQYKIDFEIVEDGQTYKDCLIFPENVYVTLTPEDIEAAKRQRFDNWKLAIEEASKIEGI